MRRFLTTLHPHLKKDGIAGFVTYLDNPDHQLLTKILLAIDKKYIGVAQFARDWAGFESQIEHTIAPHVAREIYDYLGMDLYINRLPEQFSISGQPSILMGLNHEAIIEPIYLLSLLDRADIRFLGMKVFKYLGPNIGVQFLPVLPNKVATDYEGDSKTTISNRFDIVYQLYRMEDRTSEEIKALNQQSINQATEHVASGGVLMLYPCGGRSIEDDWYPGIGRILNGLPPEILASTTIFPVKTVGLTRKLVYGSIHRAAFRRQTRHSVFVNILDTLYVPSQLAGAGPEKIVDYLRTKTAAMLHDPSRDSWKSETRRFPFDKPIAIPVGESPPVPDAA